MASEEVSASTRQEASGTEGCVRPTAKHGGSKIMAAGTEHAEREQMNYSSVSPTGSTCSAPQQPERLEEYWTRSQKVVV